MRIRQYEQIWPECRRIILVSNKGSVFVDISNIPDEHQTKAFIWGLNVNAEYRCKGIGKLLLERAEDVVRSFRECSVSLIWGKPTPQWVFNWYVRMGYEEREFGDGCAKMYKVLVEEL